MNVLDFEMLLVSKADSGWEVKGITYSGSLLPEPGLKTAKASFLAIQLVKESLMQGKRVFIADNCEFTEVQPKDLVINELDELQRYKQLAFNQISNLMHSNTIGVCVLDAMEYMDMYMKLLNAGIFITDQNREDKYLEIIEQSQTAEEPAPLSAGSTFEEEQAYVEKKKAHEQAQQNLANLEKYLNAYDKLFNIKHTNDMLTAARDAVVAAETKEQVDEAMKTYMQCNMSLHPKKFI